MPSGKEGLLTFPSLRVTVIPYIPGILQMEAIPGISYRTALWKPMMNAKYFRVGGGGGGEGWSEEWKMTIMVGLIGIW